ncbi:hypothetical protein EWM64_g3118 [Hericium alpestre]|uniref:RING-type domain-containing protein n=1 Tax=Hericium alpestre TaxID=135208 RepID=A0A4Z0A369_9AGAM|nr:hypothetical protein EWM64_g3118 [Hericium alpestre]
MAFKRADLEQFSSVFGAATELSSVAIGGKIIEVSDEFFAEAFHLLLVEPAPSLKGQFGPKGALYSGWETRRHNPDYDWAIIKLGTTGSVIGFDIDTTHFNGNEAPEVSVQTLLLPDGEEAPSSSDPQVPETKGVNYVKLNMYPDGGIARFRVYGHVVPVHPASNEIFDVAHVFAGGRVVFTSDQHFGVGSNLILPGRGKDMGDGWETKRSRQPGHKDWVIIKLGAPAILSHVTIDTAHFKGNFPQTCELHAIRSPLEIPPHAPSHPPPASCSPRAEHRAVVATNDEWILVLPKTPLGPHREHSLRLDNTDNQPFTHVRLTIYPDGGVKRVRVFGKKAGEVPLTKTVEADAVAAKEPPIAIASEKKAYRTIPALPLTPEAFAPFGQVIQSYLDIHAVPSPRTTKITPANFGTATKFHKLSLLESIYPEGSGATPGISVYRCQPVETCSDSSGKAVKVELKALERHPYTNQAFIPMGADQSQRYLVVVTKDADNGKPDLKSVRAFVATGAQGIVYKTAVWHQPMTVLEKSWIAVFTCRRAILVFSCVPSAIYMLAMESRKRPYPEEPEPLYAKKRALTDSNDSPVHINGVVPSSNSVDDEEPRDQSTLEQFRKEAIFRRMKHYARENSRSQARIAELEHRKSSYEASLAVMGACWSQLLDTIRALVNSEDLPDSGHEAEADLLDLSRYVSSDEDAMLAEALDKNAHTTHKLVAKFVKMSSSGIRDEELKKQFRDSQAECGVLRSQLALTKAELADSQALCEQYQTDLHRAESRFDRQDSSTVRAVHGHGSASPSSHHEMKAEEVKGEGVKSEGTKIEDVKMDEPESKREPSSSASPPPANGLSPNQEDWMHIAHSREEIVKQLELQVTGLQAQVLALESERQEPSAETITNTPYYQSLLHQISGLQHTNSERNTIIETLRKEVASLEASKIQWQEEAKVLADAAVVEAQKALTKKSEEAARLRQARDQLAAELHERKSVDLNYRKSLDEMTDLAKNREERITVLLAEVSRLKALTAAKAGDGDLMNFFLWEKSGNVSYVDDLKQRLEASEARATSIEQQLAFFEEEHPDVIKHMRSEAEARQQLAEAMKLLNQYQATYGKSSTLPPETKQLMSQLERNEQELKALRLQEAQHTQAETALYGELDQLSAAWESLDKQVKKKVYDLADCEQRLEKACIEKAKADNKYWGAMRFKEASENALKNYKRDAERQARLLDAVRESEKALKDVVSNFDRELSLHKQTSARWKLRVEDVEMQRKEYENKSALEAQKAARSEKSSHIAEERLHSATAHIRKLEDELTKAKREAEKASSVIKAKPQTSSQKEAGLQKEIDKCMSILKCSTCRINMRNTVITKCMHSFCKQCVEARIATRQRKCPACNLPFAHQDVQQLYFQ